MQIRASYRLLSAVSDLLNRGARWSSEYVLEIPCKPAVVHLADGR